MTSFQMFMSIISMREELDKYSDTNDALGLFVSELVGGLLDDAITLLEKHIQDKDQWISWWLWDATKPRVVQTENGEVNVDDPEAFWEFLLTCDVFIPCLIN